MPKRTSQLKNWASEGRYLWVEEESGGMKDHPLSL